MKTLTHAQTEVSNRRRGFSLVELVITMTIMTILVGVVSMRASGMTDKARAARIIQTVDALRTPVMLYHEDTGALPREYSGWDGASFHRLSMDPGVNGWDGPYIDDPIRRSWNPTGGQVHLFNYVVNSYSSGNGFDLDGDGTMDVNGNSGAMMTFWQVEQEVAEKVDRAFDEALPGDWMDAGRVEYQPAQRRLSFLVFDR